MGSLELFAAPTAVQAAHSDRIEDLDPKGDAECLTGAIELSTCSPFPTRTDLVRKQRCAN
jgi:hypothetical protein